MPSAQKIKIIHSVQDVPAETWNALANPDHIIGQGVPKDPFVTHSFFSILEESGCLEPQTGWHSHHILLHNDDDTLVGILPCFLKDHSMGEYVFDHAWADAYQRAGGRYYPKLQSAVPFTPVTGRRFLVKQDGHEKYYQHALLQAAKQLVDQNDLSSFHITFPTQEEWEAIGTEEMILQRTDQHPHWENNNYKSFDDFLASLASRKRKGVKKERKQALEAGLTVEWITGDDITEQQLDAMYGFYSDTHSRKWGDPYLNREFFRLIAEKMGNQLLLILAKREGRYIAGAFNMIGANALFGRYWGATEFHKCLHFEICYYQAIDYAITHKLAFVNAGAGGGHKLARGYLPRASYSLHYIANPQFRQILQRHLEQEREYVEMDIEELTARGPFRKAPKKG